MKENGTGVLVVCHGNRARSPGVLIGIDGIAKERGITGLRVNSAGTMAECGKLMMPELHDAFQELGYRPNIFPGSQLVSSNLVNTADLVLCFSKQELDYLESLGKPSLGVHLIHEYAGTGEEIKDPVKQIGKHPLIGLLHWSLARWFSCVDADNAQHVKLFYKERAKLFLNIAGLTLDRMEEDGLIRRGTGLGLAN